MALELNMIQEKNSYNLEKEGMKYHLLPMKGNSRTKSSKVEGWNFLTLSRSGHEMEVTIKESREVHALILK